MNGMPDIPIQVPVDDPNADTEWNDILRQHKIIPPKPPSPSKQIEEALTQARELFHENRLEGKDLDELAELEDEEEDEAFLASYAARRRAELTSLQRREVHGQVYPLQKVDYAREVTEASKDCAVLVLLTADNDDESRVARNLWHTAAGKWRDVKFLEIRGDMCIEGYPERNCPTVLVYLKGELEKNMVKLGEWRGVESKLGDLEAWFVKVGVVKLGDTRLKAGDNDDDGGEGEGRRTGGLRFGGQQGKSKKTQEEDEDSDWD